MPNPNPTSSHNDNHQKRNHTQKQNPQKQAKQEIKTLTKIHNVVAANCAIVNNDICNTKQST